MVSNRCKIKLKEELEKLDLHFVMVDLGVVEIIENISFETKQLLKKSLSEIGLELMDDKKAILIETIKNIIIEMIYYSGKRIKLNFSYFLSEKLKQDYTMLANLFSEAQGTTIEHFIIHHKVERVKELMNYGEHSITEIASKMNYSSVSHLSSQFKKVTGLSPSQFKKLNDNRQYIINEPDNRMVASN